MDYGTRVKELCKERGITVAQLERMAGIPAKSIFGWDKSVPSFDKVQNVLDALEISYEEFADIGSPETQKIATALVRIRLASPAVYNDIMKRWMSDEQKNPATISDGYDEKHKEVNELFDQCSPEDQDLAIDFLRRISQNQ